MNECKTNVMVKDPDTFSEIVLEAGEIYRVDYGSGHEDNFLVARFVKTDVCHFYWEKPYYRKWKEYESLSYCGYSVVSCAGIRLATPDEVDSYEKLKNITMLVEG